MPKFITHAFTKKAVLAKTPKWADYTFRITFILTSAVAVFIAGTNLAAEATKYEVILGLKALDVVVFGLSKMFGVEIKE